MWLKLCLLLIYVTFLFLVARLIEAVTWYETGSLSRRLLDPMTLSVLKLKALLHQRGVTYDGVLEKSDLTQLVDSTGPAMEDEVELSLTDENENKETVFESGAHFYEQVEDAKDSVWIISVLMGDSSNQRFISENTWKSIKKRVSRFGVRAGVMDCSLYSRYCHAKGLVTPRLMLAIPQDFKTKANVKMHTYNGSSRESAVNDWIHDKLDQKIHNIRSFKEFKTDWLKYKHNFLDPEIKTVLFTNSEVIPMFYSALSLRFPGRVRFGKVDMTSPSSKKFQSYFRNNSNLYGPLPHYLIITPEDAFLYGMKRGEYLTFEALEIYFKTLYPSLNDLFILSFVIVNIMSWFEFFEVQGTFLKRFRKLLWCIIKYNVLLIMTWLPLVGFFSLPKVDKVIMIGLKVVRFLSTSSLANLIRKDIFYFSHHGPCLGLSFVLYSCFIGLIQYFREDSSSDSINVEEDLWNFNQMQTLQHLFRPADSIGQLESGLNLFPGVSRPTLWLRPSGTLDYIKQLPTWCYEEKKAQIIDNFNETHSKKVDKSTEEICYEENIETLPLPEVKGGKPVKVCNGKSTTNVQTNAAFPNCQCVICLDDYLSGIMLCGLPCGHSFHEQCILSWLGRDNHFCPVCRWPADQLKGTILHLHCE